jgi:3-mercaptopyruvate sulfurtransferase SseA
MKLFMAALALLLASLSAPAHSAQDRRYPVDPQTRWAVGARQQAADELKKQLEAGKAVLIIDVRSPERFQRETIPGAINIPFAELEGYLRTIPKETGLVFT